MAPAGLAHVEAAEKDGRWEKACAGSADMEIPEDFLTALNKLPRAKKFFATLVAGKILDYSIYRLHSAKSYGNGKKRMAQILSMLREETKLR